MAEDVICLLDQLGWTGKRELHIVGISLGGMIAQGASRNASLELLLISAQSSHGVSLRG